MHPEAAEYVAAYLHREAATKPLGCVVEFGSRNINGSARGLFPLPPQEYIGIDLYPGRDVDVVADCIEWAESGVTPDADLVLCMETLEHAERPLGLLKAALTVLKRRGTFVFTCAGTYRQPHSAIDGGPVREGEYYLNLGPVEMRRLLRLAGFSWVEVEAGRNGLDTYGWARP